MTHEAIIERRDDDRGVRCVVTYADEVIWIAPDLLAEAAPPGEVPIIGGLERDGAIINFGTPGEGLGRLWYRLRPDLFHDGATFWYVAQQIEPGADQ